MNSAASVLRLLGHYHYNGATSVLRCFKMVNYWPVIEAQMGRSFSDWQRKRAEELGLLESLRNRGRAGLPLVEDRLRLLYSYDRELAGPIVEATRTRTAGVQEALSEAAAAIASRDPAVVDFRKRLSPRRLLQPAAAVKWLLEAQAAAGEPSQWLTVLAPANLSVTRSPDRKSNELVPAIAQTSGYRVSVRTLDYVGPSGWVHRMAVRHGSLLDQLRALSEWLAGTYGWQPARSTMFVLTGQVPYIARIAVTNTLANGRQYITLQVDPATTPRELGDAYRRFRRKLLGPGRRLRSLSEKHARLGAFAVKRNPEAQWEDLHKAWNKMYPQDCYERLDLFRRDALAAERNVHKHAGFAFDQDAASPFAEPGPQGADHVPSGGLEQAAARRDDVGRGHPAPMSKRTRRAKLQQGK
jgi:hypothetical protein